MRERIDQNFVLPPGAHGVVNADGVVDFLNLNIVLSFFGQAC